MHEKRTVLVVEDERDLADLVRFNLEAAGYKCRCAYDGQTALAEIRRAPPHVLILDRMLPGLSGDEVIAKIRHEPRTANLPVIMLTAKAEESDQLVGFALGADDYITKPLSMKLLAARVEALLRRVGNQTEPSEALTAGPVSIDRSRHEVTVNGQSITLTATEFGILWELMSVRGRVLGRDQLIDKVLGVGAVVTDRTIDVHVAALRKKTQRRLRADPDHPRRRLRLQATNSRRNVMAPAPPLQPSRLFRKVFLGYAVLVTLALTVCVLLISREFDSFHIEELTRHLTAQAHVLQIQARGHLNAEHREQIDKLAKEAGPDGVEGGRITFVAADGTVLGDSMTDAMNMGSYADREEIHSALTTGWGTSTPMVQHPVTTHEVRGRPGRSGG